MGKAQRKKHQRAVSEAQHQDKRVHNKTLYLMICVFLIIVNLAIYLQVTGFEFTTFDDPVYVTQNPNVRAGLTSESAWWALTAAYAQNWHPLTWISHMSDVQLYGMDAGKHHLSAVLLHIINTLLLFFVLTLLTGYPWRSAFVAALFAVHPLHVESVAWVAERKDVLSTLFLLLTILAYIYYSAKPNIQRYLLVALAFGLGLLAKPMLVTVPFLLLILDFWPLKRLNLGWKLAIEKLPLLAMTAVSCGLTVWAQTEGHAVTSVGVIPMSERISNALMSYGIYIWKMILPLKLASYYPHPVNSWPIWQVALSAIFMIAVTVLAIRYARKAPYILAGWLWYIVTLVPVIGLMQVGLQARADRYTYIPLIGIFTIIALGVPDLWIKNTKETNKPKVLGAVAGIVILALMIPAYTQVGYWHDTRTLFTHAITVTQDNWFAESVIGSVLNDEQKYDEAVEHLQRSVEIEPRYAVAQNNLGLALVGLGKVDEGIESYKAAMKYDSNNAEVHNNWGNALLKKNNSDGAISEYRKALLINPNLTAAHFNLALTLHQKGDFDEAAGHYVETLKLDPSQADAHNNLGLILKQQGKIAEALEHLREAERLNPNSEAIRTNLEGLEVQAKAGR